MKRLIAAVITFAALAVSSNAYSADPRFANVRQTPRDAETAKPRVVLNYVGTPRALYTLAQWGATLVGAGTMQFGGDVDGGAWFSATTTAGGTDRAFTTANFTGNVGEKWIISYTVTAKTGTLAGNNVSLNTCAATGSSINNPSLGRNALVVVLTTGGACQFRLGNGTSVANANASSIRFDQVQLERVPSTRTFPYEYVRPGDARAFNYSYTASLSGGTSGLVQNIVAGIPYPIHYSRSVLVVGDSLCNDEFLFTWGGDYPAHARMHLERSYYKEFGISQRCVAGTSLPAITSSIDTAFAETTFTSGVAPWTAVIISGGVNDVLANATLETMQLRLIAAMAKVQSYGARPILVTIGPVNSATAGQNTVITAYNAWLRVLGPPVLDINAMCNNGSNMFAPRCASGDGLHPGQSFNQGQYLIGKALSNLLPLLP